MRKGFSFLELMIVMIIVVIATTLAVPSYAKYTEKSRGKSAEANLTIIYNMEKRYKLDNGVYYVCASATCPVVYYSCPAVCTTANWSSIINAELGLFIRDPYFTYSIAINGTSGYKVTASRLATGPCSGKAMTITDASSTIDKSACSVW